MKSDPPKINHVAPAWFHAWWEEVRQWMLAQVPKEGEGVSITDAPGGGKKIDVNRTSFTQQLPLSVSWIVVGESVRVKAAMVNEFVPVTVGGSGEDWEFDIIGSKWIYLEAVLAGDGEVTGANIKIATTVPSQPAGNTSTGSAPPSSYRAVAHVDGATGVITQYLFHSQWVVVVVSSWTCDAQLVRVNWTGLMTEEP